MTGQNEMRRKRPISWRLTPKQIREEAKLYREKRETMWRLQQARLRREVRRECWPIALMMLAALGALLFFAWVKVTT